MFTRSEAGALSTTERHVIVNTRNRQIDHYHPGLSIAFEVAGVFQAGGADAAGQAELGVVRGNQCLRIIVDANHGRDRPKDFLARDPHRVDHVGEQRRLQIEAGRLAPKALAAEGELCALFPAYREIFQILVELALINHRTDVGAGLDCIIDLEVTQSFDQCGDELIVNALGDDQSRGGGTTLSRGEERGRTDNIGVRFAASVALMFNVLMVVIAIIAITLWNMQQDTSVVVSADLVGLSAGRDGAPVRGSGIFVSGGGDKAGRLNVRRLETDAVYSDGGIAPGTADQITGGVFTVYGAYVDVVRNRGPVVTYGVNDMVLDNWGVVDRWTAEAKITSHGPSGIGFVNFGIVHELKVNAPIETFGQGARGFNVYTGTVNLAEFDRVVTHADGAVGIQISQPIGRLVVHRGIETFGGTGPSLVKGVVIPLSAIALSIKPGGSAREIEIAGGIKTNGPGVAPIEQHGAIDSLRVTGGFVTTGGGFDKI